MKILHVNDNYTPYGGVEQYLLSVADLLASQGHENVILYRHEGPGTLTNGRWPAYWLSSDSQSEEVTLYLRSLLDTESPDVAYIHHVASPEVVTAVAQMLPSVAYIHGFAAVCPGLAKYYRRGNQVCQRPFGWGCVPMHYLRRCSSARHPRTLCRLMQNTATLKQALLHLPKFLVGSRYMAALLAQNGFSAERIAILPPHFLPTDTDLTYMPPTEPESILFAGRLEIEKGFPYLLRVMAKLPTTVRLLVAGDGTQRSYYESLAQRLGIEAHIQFLGWLEGEAMQKVYQRCSLVVLPSICPESFGKAGVEALTHGRPVVAFDVGGISDWLHDGANGFLVKPKDTAGLVSRMNQLLQNEPLRVRMGQAGQAAVIQHYAAGQHLATLMETFESVIGAYG